MPFLLFGLFASGVLYAFGYPHFAGEGFAPLAPVTLLAAVALVERLPTFRSRLLGVLLHQIGFQVTGFYWVPFTLQEFGALPPGISHLVALGLAPMLNPALWGWVAWLRWRPRLPGAAHWDAGMAAFFGAVWMTALENFIPQQFPVFAGHVWMQYPTLLRAAPWGGVATYSFFTWWLIMGLLPLARRQRPARSALAGALVFALVHPLLPPLGGQAADKYLNVRVVQANIGNLLKTESETGDPLAVSDVVGRYRDLSLRESPQELDLIVWPETAYPFPFHTERLVTGDENLPEVFVNLMARTNAEILIGGYDSRADADTFMERYETDYNAAFLFGGEGQLSAVYRKHILIPFGETLPFGPLNRPLSRVLPAVSFFARGTKLTRFTTRRGPTFVAPICYEILQSEFVRRMVSAGTPPVDFIVNLTNDSWYGATAEPAQHLFLAKWRALEFQRPIVRATNTGISTIIYPDGREGRRLLTGEMDVMDVRLGFPARPPSTFFERYGLWGLMGLWVTLAAIFSLSWWRRNRP